MARFGGLRRHGVSFWIFWPTIVIEQLYALYRHPSTALYVADAVAAVAIVLLPVVFYSRRLSRALADRLSMAAIVVLGADALGLLVWMYLSQPLHSFLAALIPVALMVGFFVWVRTQIARI